MTTSTTSPSLGLPGRLSPLEFPESLGYAVLDLETTGLSATSDRIVSFAVIQLNPQGVMTATMNCVVNPGCPIPPESTAVHGLTDEDVASKPTFAERVRPLREIIDGRALIAFNAAFDVPFLLAEFERAGHAYTPLRTGCVMNAAQVAYPLAVGHRLPQVAELLSLDPPDDEHDAFSDAHAAAAITASMIREGLDPAGTTIDTALFHRLRAGISDQPVTAAQVRRIFAIARTNLEVTDHNGYVDRGRLMSMIQRIAPEATRPDDLNRRQLQAVFDLLEQHQGAQRRQRGTELQAQLAARPGRGLHPDGPSRWPQP
ncbi:MAG: 3'-5' exonuclease [Gaiellales bacterium]